MGTPKEQPGQTFTLEDLYASKVPSRYFPHLYSFGKGEDGEEPNVIGDVTGFLKTLEEDVDPAVSAEHYTPLHPDLIVEICRFVVWAESDDAVVACEEAGRPKVALAQPGC